MSALEVLNEPKIYKFGTLVRSKSSLSHVQQTSDDMAAIFVDEPGHSLYKVITHRGILFLVLRIT